MLRRTALALRRSGAARRAAAFPAAPVCVDRVELGARAPRARALSTGGKIVAPPMVYISGEEMTKHTMDLILEEWIRPHVDISAWEFYDLSCVSRASLR